MRKAFLFIALTSLIFSCKNKGWSVAERNQFITTCTNGAAMSMGQDKAKDYCSCMAQKLEAKYPNYTDANKLTSQSPEIITMAQGCLGINMNNNNNNNNNPGGNIFNNNNNNNNNNNTGGGWTKDDEQ